MFGRLVISMSSLWKVVIHFLVAFLVLPQMVSAVGIGISPAKIVGEVRIDESVSYTVRVQNMSGAPADYEVYVDSYESWFSFSEQEFTLGINGIKEVSVTIDPDISGKFETNISVVSFLSERQSVNTGSGIKIPVILSVIPRPTIFGIDYILFYALFVACLVFVFISLIMVFSTGRKYKRSMNTNKRCFFTLFTILSAFS